VNIARLPAQRTVSPGQNPGELKINSPNSRLYRRG
jgi:hypothetical protein